MSDGSRSGVPVHVVARRILDEATTLDEAVAVARMAPVAASSVLTVVAAQAGSPRAASIELTPAGDAVVEATPGRVLAHTNHFLDPGLAAGQVLPPASTTAERLACLTEHAPLVALPDPLERALALGALPDAPITMRPRADAPPHQRWSSKATLALDVVDPRSSSTLVALPTSLEPAGVGCPSPAAQGRRADTVPMYVSSTTVWALLLSRSRTTRAGSIATRASPARLAGIRRPGWL
ncbi:carcinine hydrolase/isopenicillin-N N-acyltransferase family protein [Jiangella alkaliphila]|uniref:carcinine hydrolase/isopenicillin-N N-acyltransferase family protein n=1 Tax=Jiangella alkaliphila TaxID=419479 RepID=UPI000699BE6F|nr:carcinine hydrolase/isopenicillin-N N-acyltransferase family protein [Jiangella alkaliphila]